MTLINVSCPNKKRNVKNTPVWFENLYSKFKMFLVINGLDQVWTTFGFRLYLEALKNVEQEQIRSYSLPIPLKKSVIWG